MYTHYVSYKARNQCFVEEMEFKLQLNTKTYELLLCGYIRNIKINGFISIPTDIIDTVYKFGRNYYFSKVNQSLYDNGDIIGRWIINQTLIKNKYYSIKRGKDISTGKIVTLYFMDKQHIKSNQHAKQVHILLLFYMANIVKNVDNICRLNGSSNY